MIKQEFKFLLIGIMCVFMLCVGLILPCEAQYYAGGYYGGYPSYYGGGYYSGGYYPGSYYGGGYAGGYSGGYYPGSYYGGGYTGGYSGGYYPGSYYGGGYAGGYYGGYGGYYGGYGAYGGGLETTFIPPGSYPMGYQGFELPIYSPTMYLTGTPLHLTYAQNLAPSSNMSFLARGFYSWANRLSGLGGLFGMFGGFW